MKTSVKPAVKKFSKPMINGQKNSSFVEENSKIEGNVELQGPLEIPGIFFNMF